MGNRKNETMTWRSRDMVGVNRDLVHLLHARSAAGSTTLFIGAQDCAAPTAGKLDTQKRTVNATQSVQSVGKQTIPRFHVGETKRV